MEIYNLSGNNQQLSKLSSYQILQNERDQDIQNNKLVFQSLQKDDKQWLFNFELKNVEDFNKQKDFQCPPIEDDLFETNKDLKLVRLKKQKRNQTKNIPKNYGKAIISHIVKNKINSDKLLQLYSIKSQQLHSFLKLRCKNINTIFQLRNLWNDQKYGKIIRILSYEFMRKYSLPYIFRSRIRNYMTHLKYRVKLMEGIKNPSSFINMKDY